MRNKAPTFFILKACLSVLEVSLFFMASGCKTEAGKDDVNSRHLSIDTFSSLPDTIKGCGTIYSASRSDYKAEEYIYADNLQGFAYMIINDDEVEFTNFTSEPLPHDSTRTVYRNKDFEVTILTHIITRTDESYEEEGTLTLRSKKGKIVTRKIYGESGC